MQAVHAFWVFGGLAVTAGAGMLLEIVLRPEVSIVHLIHWRCWL